MRSLIGFINTKQTQLTMSDRLWAVLSTICFNVWLAGTLQPLILRPHQLWVIRAFQSTDNEVTPCHLLEMVYE